MAVPFSLALGAGPLSEETFRRSSKEVNALATQGIRFLTGRRIGTIVTVLMAKQASDATTYTAIDERKFAREFAKTIAAGNSY